MQSCDLKIASKVYSIYIRVCQFMRSDKGIEVDISLHVLSDILFESPTLAILSIKFLSGANKTSSLLFSTQRYEDPESSTTLNKSNLRYCKHQML